MPNKLPGEVYRDIFYNSTAAMLIISTDAPVYTMLNVNNAYLAVTNTIREDIIGKPVFGVFPGNPTDNVSKNIERTIHSFEEAIRTKTAHTMSNYRYDIPVPGTNEFEERYWTTSNTPVLDQEGEVKYFIHSPQDVTALYKIMKKEKEAAEALLVQQQQLYSTFMQAPVGIAIFKGPDFIVDLINPSMSELYQKTMDEMMGRPVFDVLTHSKGQGFEELLNNVRVTGKPYRGTDLPATLFRNGKPETAYLDFVYEPYRENDGSIAGVIAVAIDVTEQRNTKNQIKEAEERARLAVDAVGLGTFDLSLETGEMITSTRFANIFGFESPASRRDYVAVFHPDDLETRIAAHRAAVTAGGLSYEARVIWKDKSVHWTRVEGKVFYNKTGKAIRILGTLLNITEQRKAKEEHRKLMTLVDNSVDLMSIVSLDGFSAYMNDAGKEILGLETAEQINTVPVFSLHSIEDKKLVEEEVLPTVMRNGKWSGIIIMRHLQTGETFPVFNNCIRIDDPVLGIPIAIGIVMRDLRPELSSKQALAESELLLKNITTAAPTALWMSDEKGLITYVNQTWIDWSGQSYAENLGEGWAAAIVPEDRQRASDKFINDLTARKKYEVEFRINHSDGSIHWCFANGKPQYRNDGGFTGYIGACVDITEQKYLQKQKDDFIGIASHELKTPVTSIKGYTQILEKMLLKKGDTQQAAMMTRMNAQVNRLTSLIGDLLDVTKLNSGKLQFNDRNFEFNAMVEELVEDLRLTDGNHTIIEKYNETGTVYGDRERIAQVITNLITNAIKYSPQSDKIVVHITKENGEAILCVEDFGIGIAHEKQQKVFEQFYRVSGNMQHTFPGLGLGLYISSEIIKRERGRIWVNSSEGEGSTFCFALPLATGEETH